MPTHHAEKDPKSPQSAHTHRQPTDDAAPASEHDDLLQLQRMIGNRAMQRLMAQRKIQPKLTVGAADDVYEQEADQVAHEVMTMPDAVQREDIPEEEEELALKRIQREDMPEEDEELALKRIQREDVPEEEEELALKRIQREDMPEEDEDLLAQTKSTGGVPDVSDEMESQINSATGGGQSLPDPAREFFEPRFGQDFGSVNIHTGAEADALNRSLEARAFTTGSDIFFRDGEYDPGSSSGRELLAHELTHVVQQGASQAQRKNEECEGC